ncbi:hypothetical protein O181_054026 [Austropuccinia psidii MF-1]|uniref:Uncharacterized protein n=1 Tax=Austropuccinia psidii MF-1 TaxID=1389203 RepID=A0A9Q3E8N0_9BASI|nr:hypothetical protein [Austropuccinia psidii MF-1]
MTATGIEMDKPPSTKPELGETDSNLQEEIGFKNWDICEKEDIPFNPNIKPKTGTIKDNGGNFTTFEEILPENSENTTKSHESVTLLQRNPVIQLSNVSLAST